MSSCHFTVIKRKKQNQKLQQIQSMLQTNSQCRRKLYKIKVKWDKVKPLQYNNIVFTLFQLPVTFLHSTQISAEMSLVVFFNWLWMNLRPWVVQQHVDGWTDGRMALKGWKMSVLCQAGSRVKVVSLEYQNKSSSVNMTSVRSIYSFSSLT